LNDSFGGPGGRGGNGGNGEPVGGTQSVRISSNQDGTFQFDNVIPGSYIVYASARSNNVPVTAYGRLDVTFGNIDNYTLMLRPGLEVSGQIYLDGEAPQNFRVQSTQISLSPMDNLPVGNVRGTVAQDGKITLQDVAPGRYRLTVGGLQGGAYLAKALVAGSDVLGEAFQLDGDGTPLQMLLGFTQGRIDAVVEKAGMPLGSARVLLAPANRNRLDLFKTASSDKDGKVSFSNVPPGNYKLFAWESMAKANAYLDPRFLESYEDHGRPIFVEKMGSAMEGHLQALGPVQ
jgi:hypothetical protein